MKELYTERLHLRYVTEADTQRIFDCWASDPEVSKYVTWNAHPNVEVTKGYVGFIMEEYKKSDTYRWGIEIKATGELIGIIDVMGYHNGEPVIGYCSGKAYWGNSHTHLIADFYDRLVRGEQPYILPEDGMETTRLMEQAYLSTSTIRRRSE